MSLGIARAKNVIAVRGELDIATAPDLRAMIAEAVATHPGASVVVDLSGVDFIDSIGFGVLIGGRRRAQAEGGGLVLANASDEVKRALEVCGLADVFELHDTLEAARSHG